MSYKGKGKAYLREKSVQNPIYKVLCQALSYFIFFYFPFESSTVIINPKLNYTEHHQCIGYFVILILTLNQSTIIKAEMMKLH